MSKYSKGVSIETLYRRMVAETPQSHGYGCRKGESVATWQRRLRRKLLELLAIDARAKLAPHVRFVEEVKCKGRSRGLGGYLRRRGYMLAADGLAVPFYLLEPLPRPEGKLGVCIAAHGHGPGKDIPVGIARDEKARKLIVGGQRDYALQAVGEGYLTIVPEFRGFGELMLPEDVQKQTDCGCDQLALRSFHLARPLMGQRLSDVMQFLDWALAHKDVDRKRVVITGNSGGGMMSLFTAAIDKRITAAAPSCYFSSFAASILGMQHCGCNYVPGLQRVAEMSDLAGLVAPRPMLIIAGTKDRFFPIDAVRGGFAAAKKIYTNAGAAENLELFEGAGGHRYYAHRVWDFFREKIA